MHLVLGLRVGSTSEEKLDQIHVAIQSSLLQQVMIRQVKVKLCTVYTPTTCNHWHFLHTYTQSVTHHQHSCLIAITSVHVCSCVYQGLGHFWISPQCSYTLQWCPLAAILPVDLPCNAMQHTMHKACNLYTHNYIIVYAFSSYEPVRNNHLCVIA